MIFGAPSPQRHFVARKREIPYDQPVLRMLGMRHRLQPAMVLHALAERVADDHEVIARLQRERGGRALRQWGAEPARVWAHPQGLNATTASRTETSGRRFIEEGVRRRLLQRSLRNLPSFAGQRTTAGSSFQRTTPIW